MARALRMLGDGSHNGELVSTKTQVYQIEEVPLESYERYTQQYGEAMGFESPSADGEEFAEPTGCPCNSTF